MRIRVPTTHRWYRETRTRAGRGARWLRALGVVLLMTAGLVVLGFGELGILFSRADCLLDCPPREVPVAESLAYLLIPVTCIVVLVGYLAALARPHEPRSLRRVCVTTVIGAASLAFQVLLVKGPPPEAGILFGIVLVVVALVRVRGPRPRRSSRAGGGGGPSGAARGSD